MSHLLLMTFLTNGFQAPQYQWKECVDCERDCIEKKKSHLVAFHGQPMNFSTSPCKEKFFSTLLLKREENKIEINLLIVSGFLHVSIKSLFNYHMHPSIIQYYPGQFFDFYCWKSSFSLLVFLVSQPFLFVLSFLGTKSSISSSVILLGVTIFLFSFCYHFGGHNLPFLFLLSFLGVTLFLFSSCCHFRGHIFLFLFLLSFWRPQSSFSPPVVILGVTIFLFSSCCHFGVTIFLFSSCCYFGGSQSSFSPSVIILLVTIFHFLSSPFGLL